MRGHKIGPKNFANLLVGAPMADETGRNLGQLLITGIWTFGFSYKIPDLESLGQISSYYFPEILPSFSKGLIKSITFFKLFNFYLLKFPGIRNSFFHFVVLIIFLGDNNSVPFVSLR